jgi:hypothetical protein
MLYLIYKNLLHYFNIFILVMYKVLVTVITYHNLNMSLQVRVAVWSCDIGVNGVQA